MFFLLLVDVVLDVDVVLLVVLVVAVVATIMNYFI